jgi:hypothetical protein
MEILAVADSKQFESMGGRRSEQTSLHGNDRTAGLMACGFLFVGFVPGVPNSKP